MNSALRTFLSAIGVGSACYVLAMASWQQVLYCFLAASLGWCAYVWSSERKRAIYIHPAIKAEPELPFVEAKSPTAPEPSLPPFIEQARPSIIRPLPTGAGSFPMHKLVRQES